MSTMIDKVLNHYSVLQAFVEQYRGRTEDNKLNDIYTLTYRDCALNETCAFFMVATHTCSGSYSSLSLKCRSFNFPEPTKTITTYRKWWSYVLMGQLDLNIQYPRAMTRNTSRRMTRRQETITGTDLGDCNCARECVPANWMAAREQHPSEGPQANNADLTAF